MSTSAVTERISQEIPARSVNKSCYQADQEVKLLHLQAEVDCLLQELQNLKMQRQSSTSAV
ncbi:hypothetical protein [Calothrix sp. UHCC 0171]|uniref:hypothetical protein n=1 Tax=Calothrix sp. UHCC 0171 TaxID=3110245 RepID=UPI002B21035A|nr:hypothetical protein [Calothrix sp. UHCC 0171]MEA5573911.1 hypothetical protein [Calothrix sp. UHCC 0171]